MSELSELEAALTEATQRRTEAVGRWLEASARCVATDLSAIERLVGTPYVDAVLSSYRETRRDLRLASIDFVATLIEAQSGGPRDSEPLELAERVRAAVAFVEET